MKNGNLIKRVVCVADLHLRAVEALGDWRIEDKFKAFANAIELAKVSNADLFVMLGDMFDHMNPPEWLRLRFFEELSKLGDGIEALFVVGNHETDGRDSWLMESTQFFSSKNFTVISKETKVFNIFIDGGTEIKIGFVPWQLDWGTALCIVQSCSVVFGHVPILGALTSGEQFLLRDGVDVSLGGYGFFGHYHARQTLKNIKGLYIGSLVTQNFGEVVDLEKGFCGVNILMVDNKVDVGVEFFSSGDREFRVIEFDENSWNDIDLANLKYTEGSVIKVILDGSREWILTNAKNFEEIRKVMLSQGVKKVVVDFRVKSDLLVTVPVGGDILNVDSMIESYTDDEKFKNYGLEVYNNVKQKGT